MDIPNWNIIKKRNCLQLLFFSTWFSSSISWHFKRWHFPSIRRPAIKAYYAAMYNLGEGARTSKITLSKTMSGHFVEKIRFKDHFIELCVWVCRMRWKCKVNVGLWVGKCGGMELRPTDPPFIFRSSFWFPTEWAIPQSRFRFKDTLVSANCESN